MKLKAGSSSTKGDFCVEFWALLDVKPQMGFSLWLFPVLDTILRQITVQKMKHIWLKHFTSVLLRKWSVKTTITTLDVQNKPNVTAKYHWQSFPVKVVFQLFLQERSVSGSVFLWVVRFSFWNSSFQLLVQENQKFQTDIYVLCLTSQIENEKWEAKLFCVSSFTEKTQKHIHTHT